MAPPPTPSKPNKRRSRRQTAKGSTRARAYRNGWGLGPNIAISVLDISETGVRLLMKEELPVGHEFEVNLEGPGSHPVKMLANVAWCIRAEDGNYCLGASFQKSMPYAALMALGRA